MENTLTVIIQACADWMLEEALHHGRLLTMPHYVYVVDHVIHVQNLGDGRPSVSIDPDLSEGEPHYVDSQDAKIANPARVA